MTTQPHRLAGQIFSIVARQTEEVLIALFKSADVAGILHGEMRADRKIAYKALDQVVQSIYSYASRRTAQSQIDSNIAR